MIYVVYRPPEDDPGLEPIPPPAAVLTLDGGGIILGYLDKTPVICSPLAPMGSNRPTG